MKKILINLFLLLPVLLLVMACACAKSERTTQKKISSITLFGNSIVAHDPAPAIGWEGNWGMAASCRDSDFVHIIKAEIGRIGRSTEVTWGNLAAYEREWATYDLSQLDKYGKSDLIVIKISENIQYEQGMEARFLASYDRLIKQLSGPETIVVIAEGFWPSPVNDMLRKYAASHNHPFVALADLFANDKSNAAIGFFENEGVANHPSDKGMRNIAARIMKVIDAYKFK